MTKTFGDGVVMTPELRAALVASNQRTAAKIVARWEALGRPTIQGMVDAADRVTVPAVRWKIESIKGEP